MRSDSARSATVSTGPLSANRSAICSAVGRISGVHVLQGCLRVGEVLGALGAGGRLGRAVAGGGDVAEQLGQLVQQRHVGDGPRRRRGRAAAGRAPARDRSGAAAASRSGSAQQLGQQPLRGERHPGQVQLAAHVGASRAGPRAGRRGCRWSSVVPIELASRPASTSSRSRRNASRATLCGLRLRRARARAAATSAGVRVSRWLPTASTRGAVGHPLPGPDRARQHRAPSAGRP